MLTCSSLAGEMVIRPMRRPTWQANALCRILGFFHVYAVEDFFQGRDVVYLQTVFACSQACAEHITDVKVWSHFSQK